MKLIEKASKPREWTYYYTRTLFRISDINRLRSFRESYDYTVTVVDSISISDFEHNKHIPDYRKTINSKNIL